MIGHRDGHLVTVCDRCFRPRRTGEDGWQHSDEGGYREAVAQAGPPSPRAPQPAPVVQPEQGLDYCPQCAAGLPPLGYLDAHHFDRAQDERAEQGEEG